MVWLTSSFFALPVLMTALVRLAERSVFFHDGHCTVTSSVEVRGGRRQGRGWSAWQEAQCHTVGMCTQQTRQCCLSVCLSAPQLLLQVQHCSASPVLSDIRYPCRTWSVL